MSAKSLQREGGGRKKKKKAPRVFYLPSMKEASWITTFLRREGGNSGTIKGGVGDEKREYTNNFNERGDKVRLVDKRGKNQ